MEGASSHSLRRRLLGSVMTAILLAALFQAVQEGLQPLALIAGETFFDIRGVL